MVCLPCQTSISLQATVAMQAMRAELVDGLESVVCLGMHDVDIELSLSRGEGMGGLFERRRRQSGVRGTIGT